jgi:NADPH:quinone reductase-like Zn-dependent oxidoreductase
VDVILDIMGGSYSDSNVASLARRGRLVSIGFLRGSTVKDFNLLALMAKQALSDGFADALAQHSAAQRSAEEKAQVTQAVKSNIWPLLSSGQCLPLIDRIFPLADAAGAHQRMEEGEHIGKILLKVL